MNGLLIPGGASSIWGSAYSEASQYLFDLAKIANDAGDVFPVWGTCLGFEMLGAITTGGQRYLARCNSYDQALGLDLGQDWEQSNLLGQVRQY